MSSVRVRGSRPCCTASATTASARPGSCSMNASRNSSSGVVSSGSPPPDATSSSADTVSRADPPPWRRTDCNASSVRSMPASSANQRMWDSITSIGNRWNCRCCVRLRMVSLTFCGSVVANTKTTWGGGSSKVFSNAASAPLVSMCTSSRMYTRWRPGVPSAAFSMISRIASTPLLLAASSSCTSKLVPRSTARHESHSQHGSPSCGFSQLSTLARMRADVVLPVPRGPENKYA